MHAAAKLGRQRRVDHAVVFDPALPAQRPRPAVVQSLAGGKCGLDHAPFPAGYIALVAQLFYADTFCACSAKLTLLAPSVVCCDAAACRRWGAHRPSQGALQRGGPINCSDLPPLRASFAPAARGCIRTSAAITSIAVPPTSKNTAWSNVWPTLATLWSSSRSPPEPCWWRCQQEEFVARAEQVSFFLAKIGGGRTARRWCFGRGAATGSQRIGAGRERTGRGAPFTLIAVLTRARGRAAAITGKQGDCQPIASCSSSAYKESASKRTSTRQRLDYAKTPR